MWGYSTQRGECCKHRTDIPIDSNWKVTLLCSQSNVALLKKPCGRAFLGGQTDAHKMIYLCRLGLRRQPLSTYIITDS